MDDLWTCFGHCNGLLIRKVESLMQAPDWDGQKIPLPPTLKGFVYPPVVREYRRVFPHGIAPAPRISVAGTFDGIDRSVAPPVLLECRIKQLEDEVAELKEELRQEREGKRITNLPDDVTAARALLLELD